MHPLIVRFALTVLLLSSTAAAQPFSFGDAFPLTNTRYAAMPAFPTLVSNGQELLLFWPTVSNVRVTKVVEGELRGGKSALDRSASSFSVAWNGTYFLLAAATSQGIEGRLFSRSGEPVGDAFRIFNAGLGPELAWNGRSFQLLVQLDGRLYSMQLDAAGRATTTAQLLFEPAPGAHLASYDIASNRRGFAVSIASRAEVTLVVLDSEGQVVTDNTIFTSPVGHTTIANAGDDYVAAWQAVSGGAFAMSFSSAEGRGGVILALDPGWKVTSPLSVVWNGVSWLVAYTATPPGPAAASAVRIAHLDPFAQRVERHEETAGSNPSLALVNSRVYAAWRPDLLGAPAVVAPLPLGSGTPEAVTHAASYQAAGATASSNDAALIVWTEQAEGTKTLHAGLRARDGGWTERSIPATPQAEIIAAASDGRDYAIILRDGVQTEAVFLDDRGRVVRRVPLPLTAVDVDWDGTSYLLLGSAGVNGFVVAARLTPSGDVSAPVPVGTDPNRRAIAAGIATNGTTTIAAWIEETDCPILCPFTGNLKIARLGNDLKRLDAVSLVESPVLDEASVVWDGTRFLAAWGGEVATVPVFGGVQQTLVNQPVVSPSSPQLTAVAGGVALTLNEGGSNSRVNHVLLLRHDNSRSSVAFPEVRNFSAPRVAALPDGGSILYIESRPNFDAPHHGSPRLMARVASIVPVVRPDAPSLEATVRSSRIRLNWSVPAQPVNGYRVEYRLSDGSWHELEQWFDPEERSVTLTWTVSPGVPVMFRVRAFNDAGPSDYSPTSGINVPRRRSVRR
ncbi:MAG TPA: fibronectin type III domain-containing protein [Thermoanaerobaculia bacterium]|nr:fibronectin type III domain-containing protein [Thermoanaerobaculia bacterium]